MPATFTLSPVNVAVPALLSDTLTVPASEEPSGPLDIAIGQDHHQFFAAIAADDIGLAYGAAQRQRRVT